MQTNRKRRLTALLSAAVIAVPVLTGAQTAEASGTEQKSFLVLGDSISAGYGLSSGESAFYDYITEDLSAQMTNLAVSGMETQGLIDLLETEDAQSAVKKADLISVSIGGNDLLTPARAYFAKYKKEGETEIQTLKRLAKSDHPMDYISALTRTLLQPIRDAKANVAAIAEKIHGLNPDATLVMQTVYNPFEFSERELSNVTSAQRKDYDQVLNYVRGLIAGLNTAISNLQDTETADVCALFRDNAPVLVRTKQNDVHPNLLGHAVIASAVEEAAGIAAKKSARTELGRDIYATNADDWDHVTDEVKGRLQARAVYPALTFGDADRNGKVDAKDAMRALRYFDDWQTFNPTELTVGELTAAEVTGDGSVNLADAMCILLYDDLTNRLFYDDVSWRDVTRNPNAPD